MPYHAETIVVGCGNILFKDDGFGPFVIHKLEEYFEDKEMPDEVMFIDAGTGATHFIFSLPDEYWKKVIVEVRDQLSANINANQLLVINTIMFLST